MLNVLSLPETATSQRWLRIIPVALVMYTISYVDRTNVNLALDPKISSLMNDLAMDNRLKGRAAGIFFIGYALLQIPGALLATRWSAKKFISICLVAWGACAVACGLARTSGQFEAARFCLGLAESGVFPATTILLSQWFPRAERARANALWSLCQPLAVVASAPVTGWLLGAYGWHTTLMLEGALPFLWLPVWWFFISDHPREAKWISPEEREHLEATLSAEAADRESSTLVSIWPSILTPSVLVMLPISFLYNCEAYGCMTFFTDMLNSRNLSGFERGVFLAVPYAVTAVFMIVISRSSDRTGERRGHVGGIFLLSGITLIASVLCRDNFWLSFVLICLAIPAPFTALGPFWAIPAETLPAKAMAIVIGGGNALGNLGGFAGPYITGWLKDKFGNVVVPFIAIGIGMLIAAALCLVLPKSKPRLKQI